MADFTTEISPRSALIRFNDGCTIKVSREVNLTFIITYVDEKTGDVKTRTVEFHGAIG